MTTDADVRNDSISEVRTRRLSGAIAKVATALSAGLSLYALYWVVGIVQPQLYRTSFLLVTLTLTFLLYPASQRSKNNITTLDWSLVVLTLLALGWPIVDLNQFVYRAATPTNTDLVLGILTTALVLEATRRTIGPILPITAICLSLIHI